MLYKQTYIASILLPTYQWWHCCSWGVDLLYTVHYCTPIKLSLCAKTIFCSWCITYKKQNDAITCINKLKRIIIRQTKHKDKNCLYLKHERLYKTSTFSQEITIIVNIKASQSIANSLQSKECKWHLDYIRIQNL